jgi:signal transduction histidine kinase/ligand-binding sensor domain-containing protein/DNA-binding response OmpR family regulator
MNGFLRISVLAVIIFFVATGLACSQNQKYRFHHLTTENGLPSNFCWQVMKDSRGFIWITTRAGVCRYDGFKMKVYQYQQDDPASLSDNRITGPYSMVEDNSGNLWFGTYSGLNKFDFITETFKRYRHDSANPLSIRGNTINCLLNDRNGILWIGTGNRGGLSRYDPKSDKFTSFTRNPGDSSWQIGNILSLYEDKSGKLWVGAVNGFYWFNKTTSTFVRLRSNQNKIPPLQNVLYKFITEDSEGTLLAGTQYGFLKFDRIKNELVPFDPLYDEEYRIRYLDFFTDPSGDKHTHWLLTFGLFKFNSKTLELSQVLNDPADPSSLRGGVLKSIFRDEAGMLWIPGDLGVNILDPKLNQFERHPEFEEKFGNSVNFLKDNKGDLWFGAYKLVHLDKNMKLVRVYSIPQVRSSEFTGNSIWDMLEDSEKNLWIGFDFTGLCILDKNADKLILCKLFPTNPAIIYNIYEDSGGNIWICTDAGLYRRRKGETPLTFFHQDTSFGMFNKSTFLCLREDWSGNLWVGTAGKGLFYQSVKQKGTGIFHHFSHDPGNTRSLGNDWVWSIYEDKVHTIWLATENGINKVSIDDSSFTRYYSSTDPGANFIYDLTGDNKGFLWMTTEDGLYRFNTTGIMENDKKSDLFKQVLPFSDIFQYELYMSNDGQLFIGGTQTLKKNGYFSFYPDKLEENTRIPPVVITDFRIRDEQMKLDTNITLKKSIILTHKQNSFSFEFAALDYTNPDKNQYACKLEGLEKDWVTCGSRRYESYTKVPPGKYLFRVKGSNNDGYWNEAGTWIHVTILPPPWKTWWSYLLYGLFIFAIGYFIARFYFNRLKMKHQLEMEHVEAEKLKELDHLKSSFFANISHEFRTPLTLILGPLQGMLSKTKDPESKKEFGIMQRSALRLQRLIDQLLSLAKLEAGQMKLQASENNIVRLVKSYLQQFESLAIQKGIDLTFRSKEEEIPVFVDPDKLEKVLYNLLSNAFKFTGDGGRIVVEVGSRQSAVSSSQFAVPSHQFTTSPLHQFITITISDTGSGIPPDKLPYIFDRFYQADDANSRRYEGTGIGLALTKELVELHHGTIKVESEVGKGTAFFVNLPLGKKHLKTEEISNIEHPTSNIQHPASSIQHPVSSIRYQLEKPALLIVEDNADLRDYIHEYLIDSYQVIEAADGKEGLEQAIEKIPDLIISDVMMPKMDGFELCARLKTDERTSHIPVILLTARAGMESKIEGLETGADDFITKPFEIEELLVRIKNLIEQRRKLRERFLKNADKIGLSRLIELPESGMASMDQKFLQKATGIVEKHLENPGFSVDLFINEMAVSQVQLYRKLKAIVNMSGNEFIRFIRLSHAARMIIQKSGNITQIAYAVGFNNPSYFAECFKKQFGILPSEYPSGK